MAVAVLYGIVFTFTDMTVVYILTRGGPIDNTQVLASWAFFKGIEGGNLAQGAAIAVFLFPVLAGIAALMLRLARRTETTLRQWRRWRGVTRRRKYHAAH